MKLSNATLQILKNFAQINPSINVTPGNSLSTMSPSKAIAAFADCKETFETPFALYDLGRFLGVLSLNSEYEISFNKSAAKFTHGSSKVTYCYTDPDMIIYPKKGKMNMEPEVSFDLSEADLNNLLKAGSMLASPDIAIVGEDGDIVIKALDSDDLSSDQYSQKVGKTDKEFCVYIKTENLKFISDKYTIDVSPIATRFTSDKVVYFVANEANSTI